MSSVSEPYSHSVSHRLLLLSGADFFAFLISDKNGKELLSSGFDYKSPSQLKQQIQQESSLHEVFARIDLLMLDRDYTIIPEALALTGKMDMFRMKHKLDPLTDILRQDGTSWGAEVCFSVSAELWQVLNHSFPKHMLHSDVSLISDWLLQWSNLPKGQVVALHHSAKRMNAFVLNEQHQYKLINAYDIKDMDEWFYYVMLIIDQLGFKGEKTTVLLLAEEMFIEEASPRLSPYLHEVKGYSLIDESLKYGDLAKGCIPLQVLLAH